MAVIKCTGCGKDIPDQVSACPNCGYPMHIDRERMSGDRSFSPVLPDLKKSEKFSLRRTIKGLAIGVGIFVILIATFLYSLRVPSSNSFMQKVLDSYSSSGLTQTVLNIPTFIAGGVPPSQNSGISINQRVASPMPQSSHSTGVVSNGNSQQKPSATPQTVAQRTPAPTLQSLAPSPNEPCSQQAADVVLRENNGNPNGDQMSSGENGKTTFSGIVKEVLYKAFTGSGGSCLFASYTTWTQSTGELWQQTLDIGNTQTWYQSIWLQYVQPPESESAAFQQLDNEISLISQGGAPTASAGSATQQDMPQANIAEQSLVALLCHYSDGVTLSRGSGVIIDSQGYILTAKHIVDPQWTSWAYGTAPSNNTLEYCEVGIPPIATLPTVQQIQTFNSLINVPTPFPFVATLYFEPSQGQLSNNEYRALDFAVLKITGPSANCSQSYSSCALPTAWPYSPVNYSIVPNTAQNVEVFNFGYPGEAISTSTSNNFNTFDLKGAVGPLTQYYSGDQFFKNEALNFEWSANDVIPGRSGSPVFWNGYIVGIEDSGDSGNSTIDQAIGLPAIDQILKNNGLENLLSTN